MDDLLRLRLPVWTQDQLMRLRIKFFHLFLFPDRGRRNDLDSLLSTFYLPFKFLLPCLIARHQRRIRLLHCNEERIVKTVIVELRHGLQILCVHL